MSPRNKPGHQAALPLASPYGEGSHVSELRFAIMDILGAAGVGEEVKTLALTVLQQGVSRTQENAS